MSEPTRSARRLEIYTRVSVYVMLAAVPFLFVGAIPSLGPAVGFGIGALQAAANIVVCRHSLTMLRQGRRSLTRWEAWAFGGWLLGSVLVLVAVCLHVEPDSAWMPAVCAATAAPLATVSALLRAWAIIAGSVILGGVLGVVAATRAALPPSAAVGFALAATLLMAFMGMTMWLTGWLLRNIWELDRARRTAAQLAIAEERLRIARDLHDLFGRTMAAVAVKTELAGELVRRGQSESALAQLAEVRSIAEQAGQQVRAVVQGYREDDLTTELAGARSLLGSAGIRCVVRGSAPRDLPPEMVSVLAWVLREAVTNVIRHAAATECLITIELAGRLQMLITNDGAPGGGRRTGPDLDHDGHGLIGMRERVAAVGGKLQAAADEASGRFTVDVSLPSPGGARS
jgi:two-component system sensor histidine kinase DesK